jgi:hypothetical protein
MTTNERPAKEAKPEGKASAQNETAAVEGAPPVLDLTHYDAATILRLQAMVGNRSIGQLARAERDRSPSPAQPAYPQPHHSESFETAEVVAATRDPEPVATTENQPEVHQHARRNTVQRSLVDDVFERLRTGNSVADFLLGMVAGILEWIGDLIMGLVALAGGLLELLAAADRGNLYASLGVIGIIVLIVLAVAFPEVSVPLLMGIGIVVGVFHLAYHIWMLFNPRLTAYQKGKHLGKALIEALLIVVTVLEIAQFVRAFRTISQLVEGAGAMQKIRWIIQLRRFGSLEASLAVIEEARDIEKAIQLLDVVRNADKALALIRTERNIDTLLDILRMEGMTADIALGLLGRPGLNGALLRGFLRNVDGTPRMTVAQLEALLSNPFIADVAQLQRLLNHPRIANVGQLTQLLDNIKDGETILQLLDRVDDTNKLLRLTIDSGRRPSPEELNMALMLLDDGSTIRITAESTERTADFIVNGVRTELKTISNITSSDLSGALARRILEGAGQGSHIIADARAQAGITLELAERAVRRAYGAERSGRIQQIRIIGPDFDITRPRLP